ncbi:hypothetical protein OPQ81_011248 [Rhizoctonia solani]|nr:hypothetical protein OPQ81_011248 [Rhizoctonia solani]
MNSTCPPEADPDYCNFVLANPDISGIGVRIAIYVQVALNVLATTAFQSNIQLTRDAARTSYILSISLIAASIAQWRAKGMALFDALVGVQLASIMTVFMLFNIRYISSLGLSINIPTTLFLALYTYWGIQTWNFPPCPSNALTVFVVFGKSVPATNSSLRVFALVVFACVGVVTLGAALLLLRWLTKLLLHGGEVKARAAEVWMNVKREQWGIDSGAGKSRIRSYSPIPIMIYLLITTEQIVARNKHRHSLSNLDEWSFGQTFGGCNAPFSYSAPVIGVWAFGWRDVEPSASLAGLGVPS